MVYPDPGNGAVVRIDGEKVWFMVWVGFFQEFADNKRFVERFTLEFKRRN